MFRSWPNYFQNVDCRAAKEWSQSCELCRTMTISSPILLTFAQFKRLLGISEKQRYGDYGKSDNLNKLFSFKIDIYLTHNANPLVTCTFVRLLICNMTEKITNARALICTEVLIRNLKNYNLACSEPI